MIGQTIRDLRKQRKMSQTELAKILHVSQQTVTAWETGKAEPSSSAISSLADYFNVTTDYLLGRPEKKDDDAKTADIEDDDVIFTYEGRRIPKEDLELIRRIMRGTRNDIK
ncbi:MAG TPA: helix-turn-helix domain-containing protein [Companilactobacillus farciminis]|uniref:Helix-turn-helix domain-containing protein n=1 Tax=Companilactobacillus farciminis TaxID=1612 RepID=A0A921LB15_9LACO|nr:helix-turn-helix domain-containing protein [Companilactobacillus farciminis]